MWGAADPRPSKAAMRQALMARHGAVLQAKFEGSTVAICGLGGLGSNIAIALARAGVGRLVLIDFDQVDKPLLYLAHPVLEDFPCLLFLGIRVKFLSQEPQV